MERRERKDRKRNKRKRGAMEERQVGEEIHVEERERERGRGKEEYHFISPKNYVFIQTLKNKTVWTNWSSGT